MLAAAIDVRRWLDADRQTPFAHRLERDRAIGRGISAGDDCGRVLAWWQQIQARERSAGPGARAVAADGVRVEGFRRAAVVALLLVGVVFGAAAAAVAFAYDGRHPVNLFRLLGVLVVVPGVFLLLTLLMPLRSVGSGLAALNAGRWAGALIDRFAHIELFTPPAGAPLGLWGFARWQVLVFSQWTAVGFFVGALGYGLLLVTFTDLAFGWSTTLELATADVHRVFAQLALPWAGWLPEAAPDLTLTEASRYFRGEAPALSAERAARLGAWWPFVLTVIVGYGLLPRLLLLGYGGWRLRRATRALLRDDAEVTALLDRLAAPMVAAGVGGGEAQALPLPQGQVQAATATHTGAALVLIWNDALPAARATTWLAERLGLRASATLDVGVLAGEAQQRAALSELLAAHRGTAAAHQLIVVTRGWEPPLLEFADFLGLVRELAGTEPSIRVVPIDVTGTRVEAADRAVWAATLGRLRDPRLYVQEALA